MEKQKNIPILRFPEFTGVWEKNNLGNLSDNVLYGMNSSAISFDGLNKYIRITDIDDNTRKFKPNPLTSPDGIIEDKYKLKKGDIVFARTGASVGKSYLYDENDGNLLFAGFLIKFSIKSDNAYFIYTQTLRDSYDKWVKLMSMRSGQPGINAEEFKIFSFFKPTLPEQTKIATFLTAVDERLNHLKQKKTLLEQYKKGVMQKIFDQEIRFKDDADNEYPEWEEKTLGNITLKIQAGKDKGEFAGEFDLYGSMGIIGRCSNFTYDGNYILIARVGANAGTINLVSGKFCVTDNTLVLEVNQEIDVNFCFYLLLKQNLNKLVFGSGQPLITGGQLKSESICLPTLPEQTKIANFLSAIDEKINCCTDQISKTDQYKKGLLQQMFV
ncbi:MAG: restriction endonuclease subunit S [Bacteroidota bacterium]|nr:restriction endonuclease subunit S [Bacteroidota bacterium]